MVVFRKHTRRAKSHSTQTVRLRKHLKTILGSTAIVGGVTLLTLGAYHAINAGSAAMHPHVKVRKHVPKLPRLPTLTSDKANKKQYADWHEYYEIVYGQSVKDDVDLNTFGWFYWFSPLKHVEHVGLHSGNTAVPSDTPFIFKMHMSELLRSLTKLFFGVKKVMPPENMFGEVGFFVKRDNHKIEGSDHRFIEVLRTKSEVFAEKGVAWFFNTKGSGIFLDIEPAKCIKNRTQFKFDECKPYSTFHAKGIQTLVINESDWFGGSGLVEIVHRLKGPEVIANNTTLPLHDNRGKKKPTVYHVTKHGNEILSTTKISQHLRKLKY